MARKIKQPLKAPQEVMPHDDMAFLSSLFNDGPVYVSVKLDGLRCLISDGGKTKSMKAVPNKHVAKKLATLPDGLDGELMRDGMTFHEIQSAMMRHEGEPTFTYWLFDYVDPESDPATPFSERLKALRALKKSGALPEWARVVKQHRCDTPEEVQALIQSFLDQGLEGGMLRVSSGLYKEGRATVREKNIFKFKDFVSGEFRVVGYTELMRNNNKQERNETGHAKRSKAKDGLVPGGTLGTLVLRWRDGSTFEVGTGFTAQMREKLWAMRGHFHDEGEILAEVKWGKHGVKDKPRQPVFKALRDKRTM